MQGVGFNDQKYFSFKQYDEAEYVDDGIYTIIDSASDTLYISSLWYDGFMQ